MAGQFSDFYLSLDADPAKRGKQFERFVKLFLQADPEWSTQVDQVWLWDEYPERWGMDCGIDLVFRHNNGEIWAVQAKCYSPDYHITKDDVDKFLSESNRKGIAHRLLIATTDRIGGNARHVCEAQEKPVVRFLLSDFERAELEYPANLDTLAQAKRKAPPQPFDHQNEAIHTVADLAFPVTSSVADVKRFLAGAGNRGGYLGTHPFLGYLGTHPFFGLPLDLKF